MSYNQTPPQGATGTPPPPDPNAPPSSGDWLSEAQAKVDDWVNRADAIATQLDAINQRLTAPGVNPILAQGMESQVNALTREMATYRALAQQQASMIAQEKRQAAADKKITPQTAAQLKSEAGYYDALTRKLTLENQAAQATNPADKAALQAQADAADRDVKQLQATHDRIANSYLGDALKAKVADDVASGNLSQAQADKLQAEIDAKNPQAETDYKNALVDQAEAAGKLDRTRAADIKARLKAGDPQADVDLKQAQAKEAASRVGLNETAGSVNTQQAADLAAKNATPYWQTQVDNTKSGTAVNTANAAAITGKEQRDSQGDLVTYVLQLGKAVTDGTLTQDAANALVKDKFSGSTSFDRTKEANATGQTYLDYLALNKMAVPSQQWANQQQQQYAQNFQKMGITGVSYTPAPVTTQAAPQWAQSVGMSLGADNQGLVQGSSFNAQGQLVNAQGQPQSLPQWAQAAAAAQPITQHPEDFFRANPQFAPPGWQPQLGPGSAGQTLVAGAQAAQAQPQVTAVAPSGAGMLPSWATATGTGYVPPATDMQGVRPVPLGTGG